MSNLVTQAQPALEFIEPKFSPPVWTMARSLLPLWLRWQHQIVDVEVRNPEILVDLYQQFQAGKIRFLLAFRHPTPRDPLCISQLLWHTVPQVAKQQNISLRSPTHVHFIYDRGIPLWAGNGVGWLTSRLGGTPIRRGGIDRVGLRSIRDLFCNGQFPMAASPEGGTNGHNEIITPLEPGIAQFGFWCLDDLKKAERSETVLIVPLGVQYSFVDEPWDRLDQLLQQLEQESGLNETAVSLSMPITTDQKAVLYQRLYRLGLHLLGKMEAYYLKFYRQSLPEDLIQSLNAVENTPLMEPGTTPSPANEYLANRLKTLLNACLVVAEEFFQLRPNGTVIDRCRRVEQAGWERIYREDIQRQSLSEVDQGLADRVAEEASLRLWHMRLVENFVSVTGQYVIEKLTVERFADTLVLIWKTINRMTDKTASQMPNLGSQRVVLTVGEPLSVSDRAGEYQENRRQAVAHLSQDLQAALEAMIL